MAKYLTPPILRAAGTGFPFAAQSTLDLMGLIAKAEGRIDAYAGVGGDEALMAGFAAGPARTERYPWNGATRRIYLRSRPVPVQQIQSCQIQTSQASDGTPIVYTVQPGSVILNNDQGYVEINAFSLIAGSAAYIPLPTSLIAPWVLLTYACGYRIAEASYLLGDSGDLKTYHSLCPFWLTAIQTPVLYVNGVVQVGGYTVNAVHGTVTFASARGATDDVAADFTHSVPMVITQAAVACCEEMAESYFARKIGLAGMDLLEMPGGVRYQRIGTLSGRRVSPSRDASARGGGAPEWDWRDLVDSFTGLRVATSTVLE